MTKEEILQGRLDATELHQLDSNAPDSPKIGTKKATTDSTEPNGPQKKGKKKKWWAKKSEEKEEAPEELKVPYLKLYRFASTWDWTCVV